MLPLCSALISSTRAINASQQHEGRGSLQGGGNWMVGSSHALFCLANRLGSPPHVRGSLSAI